MQNVYKSIYDYDDKQITRNISAAGNILVLFNIVLSDKRFVLMPVNRKLIKNKEIYFKDITRIDMNLSTGQAMRVTINRATIYQIDLNIYMSDGTMVTLEFRNYQSVIEFVKKLSEVDIYVNDPIGLLDIIAINDRWAIDKYFANHLSELKKQYMIEEHRKMNRYVNG